MRHLNDHLYDSYCMQLKYSCCFLLKHDIWINFVSFYASDERYYWLSSMPKVLLRLLIAFLRKRERAKRCKFRHLFIWACRFSPNYILIFNKLFIVRLKKKFIVAKDKQSFGSWTMISHMFSKCNLKWQYLQCIRPSESFAATTTYNYKVDDNLKCM